ncbi:MAG: hypothetical protein ACD_79C01236G0002 [uncultured bacterium]|nr:MAG: hypothetical protein ACD_79C01236G0002 [uncultured bacterium]
MKYVMIIPDGLGDYPVGIIGDKTPVEAAYTPNLDEISLKGRLGLCHTTPSGFDPGSDVCIMSLMGYNPKEYYSGRAPLEAESLGIKVKEDDLVIRCNLIHTNEGKIIDHCAGHITSDESKELIKTLSEKLGSDIIKFYPGVSYRNILVWKSKKQFDLKTIPPHDVPGELIEKNLPRGNDKDFLIDLMLKSRDILKDHPVNIKRRNTGKPTADMIWLWGSGFKPHLTSFKEKFGLNGCVISAVDLIRGIASIIGLKEIKVPGITGYFDTNYEGKGKYGVEALKDNDFLIIHIESPDEAGHAGKLDEKIKAIECIDKFIIGPIYEELKKHSKYRILISPDHYTPVEKKIHINEPVPFVINGYGINSENKLFSERNANESSLVFKDGYKMMSLLLT